MLLDKYIVDRKIVDSRNKTQNLISNGFVSVNNKIKTDFSYEVKNVDIIVVNEHDVCFSGWV